MIHIFNIQVSQTITKIVDCVFSSNIYNVQGKWLFWMYAEFQDKVHIAVDWLYNGVTWKALKIVIPRPHLWPMTSEFLEVGSGTNSLKTPQVTPICSLKFKTIIKKESNMLPLTESFGLGLCPIRSECWRTRAPANSTSSMKKRWCSVLLQLSQHSWGGPLGQLLIHRGLQNLDMWHDTLFVFFILILSWVSSGYLTLWCRRRWENPPVFYWVRN